MVNVDLRNGSALIMQDEAVVDCKGSGGWIAAGRVVKLMREMVTWKYR
jgi:hypothetical protein